MVRFVLPCLIAGGYINDGGRFSASKSGKPIDLTQCDQKGCLLFRPPQDPMLRHDFSINKFILWGLPHSWTPSMSIYDKSMEIVRDIHLDTSQVYGNCWWYTSIHIPVYPVLPCSTSSCISPPKMRPWRGLQCNILDASVAGHELERQKAYPRVGNHMKRPYFLGDEKLVGGLEHFLFFHLLGIIIPTG